MEEWRTVPSVPDMLASSFGRVKFIGGVRGGQPRVGCWQSCVSGQGRYIVTIFRNPFGTKRRAKNYRVARLVCEAFHGEAPLSYPESVCIHIDENASNNRPENLRWGSQKENLNFPGFLSYCSDRIGDDNPYVKGRKKKIRPA